MDNVQKKYADMTVEDVDQLSDQEIDDIIMGSPKWTKERVLAELRKHVEELGRPGAPAHEFVDLIIIAGIGYRRASGLDFSAACAELDDMGAARLTKFINKIDQEFDTPVEGEKVT